MGRKAPQSPHIWNVCPDKPDVSARGVLTLLPLMISGLGRVMTRLLLLVHAQSHVKIKLTPVEKFSPNSHWTGVCVVSVRPSDPI